MLRHLSMIGWYHSVPQTLLSVQCKREPCYAGTGLTLGNRANKLLGVVVAAALLVARCAYCLATTYRHRQSRPIIYSGVCSIIPLAPLYVIIVQIGIAHDGQ